MTNGSDATHLMVIAQPRPFTSDDRVVGDAGALPEEAHERVALVVSGEPLMVTKPRGPAGHQLAKQPAILRGQRARGSRGEAVEQRHEVTDRHSAMAVDGHQPLPVLDHEAILAG